MSRKYHKHVGGKSRQLSFLPPASISEITRARVLAANSSASKSTYHGNRFEIPEFCCPHVPPWELCEHQQRGEVEILNG